MQPRLDSSDRLILKVCCELELERRERGAALDTDTVLQEAEYEGIGREQAVESMELLNEEGYINAIYTNSEVPYLLTVTDSGFDAYGHAYISDYETLVRSVGRRIVDHNERDSTEIADALNEQLATVEHILGLFEARGFIDIRYETGPSLGFGRVSPRLNRWLQESIQGTASEPPPSALAYYLVYGDGEVLQTTTVLPGESRRRNAFMVYSTIEKLAEYNRLSGRDLHDSNIQAFVTLDQAERFVEQYRDYYEFVVPDPETGQPSALEPFERLPDVLRQLASETPHTPDEYSDVERLGETPGEIRESLELFKEDHPDRARVAFIMMQFGDTKAHREITDAIKKALATHGITGVRADDKEYHDSLWPNVRTYMHGCGLGVAVFERVEKEALSPDVALEVGYMYAMGSPVCLLKDQTLSSLHTDLVGKLFHQFDPQDPDMTIPPGLSKWLSDKGLPKR
jgi:hypothetical protein